MNGKTLLWEKRGWRIWQITGRPYSEHIVGSLLVCDETDDGPGLSHWPIQYNNKLVVWDHPEQVPNFVKAAVYREYVRRGLINVVDACVAEFDRLVRQGVPEPNAARIVDGLLGVQEPIGEEY